MRTNPQHGEIGRGGRGGGGLGLSDRMRKPPSSLLSIHSLDEGGSSQMGLLESQT